MKDNNIEILDNFVIRTPLFNKNSISKLTRENITKVMSNALVKEAIYLASPGYYSELLKYLDGSSNEEKMRTFMDTHKAHL